MASPFSSATDGEVTQFKGCLARAGFDRRLVCEVNNSPDNELARVMFEAVQNHFDKNPFEISLDDTLDALHRANDEEGWGIADEDFVRIAATAPAWPKGKHVYRSLRIRFGEGDGGVAMTFERHVARIKTVFGGEKGFWRWEHLHSAPVLYKGEPVKRLRLLAGNHTHKPVIEWVIADLDANRKRESVTAVRGPGSLADELLVVAWLFPDMVRAIDFDKYPGLFAGGYEINVPEYGDEAWRYVVIVDFRRGCRQVYVSALGRCDGRSDDSVPVLRK